MTVYRGKFPASVLMSVLFWTALPVAAPAQTTGKKLHVETNKKEESTLTDLDSAEAQRRVFAISLITSLAQEARSYSDIGLRPRVLARAGDALWGADQAMAVVLFRRAWESAEEADAEERSLKTKDKPPAMVIGLTRIAGSDSRSEVLSLVARRDRVLGEEFLRKLEQAKKQESIETKTDVSSHSSDNWFISEAVSKRLQLARRLLDEGQIERALQFADPLLNQVNANSIGFLATLRKRRAKAADDRFALMLARAELDASSDANTVSGLSSYVFTPDLYVTFFPDGGVRWSQADDTISAATPPDLPPALRDKFFRVAASILLRPLPPHDEDFSSSGRAGKYMVVKRLLPLFEHYAPDISSGLRAQLLALESDPAIKNIREDQALLTKGLRTETSGEQLDKLQYRLDRAGSSRERDAIFADMALVLADQGDARAQDLADRIDDSFRRAQVRQFVDLVFVRFALGKKDAIEVVRIATTGKLNHAQRSWAYIQAARLLIDSQHQRSLELLEAAAAEARRIEGEDPDRVLLLIGVARQLVTTEPARAWEIMDEVVKLANSAKEFSRENTQLTFPLLTKSGLRIASIGGEEFGLAGAFQLLTKNDFHRSVDLAKSFKVDALKATATLAIARSTLEK